MGLGKQIEELAKLRNISLKELSSQSGVSYNTLYAIVKRDNKTIKPEILNKIATTLNYSYEEFLSIIFDKCNADFIGKYLSELADPESITGEEMTDMIFNLKTDEERNELIKTMWENVLIEKELKNEKLKHTQSKMSIQLEKLNREGQEEAVKRVEELTHIERYKEYIIEDK